MSLHPVILAGGSGTRLWPVSRDLYPKQFLKVTGQDTLFESTLNRLKQLDTESPFVVCSESHRFWCLNKSMNF